MAPKTSDDARVAAFYSCSIRNEDQPLVDALSAYLAGRGLNCFTVGRNVSGARQPDDEIRKQILSCECLVGVATRRFTAIDVHRPTDQLGLPPAYLGHETSVAFGRGLPFLMFKTPDVQLLGVPNRNLFIEIEPDLGATGRVRFKAKRELVECAIDDLKRQALDVRKKRSMGKLVDGIVKVAATVGALGIGKWVLNEMDKPECFGTYESRHPVCRSCSAKRDCHAEKVRSR